MCVLVTNVGMLHHWNMIINISIFVSCVSICFTWTWYGIDCYGIDKLKRSPPSPSPPPLPMWNNSENNGITLRDGSTDYILCSILYSVRSIIGWKAHETCRVFVMANLLLGCMLFDCNFVLGARNYQKPKAWREKKEPIWTWNQIAWIPFQLRSEDSDKNRATTILRRVECCTTCVILFIWMWRWLLWMKPGTGCERCKSAPNNQTNRNVIRDAWFSTEFLAESLHSTECECEAAENGHNLQIFRRIIAIDKNATAVAMNDEISRV